MHRAHASADSNRKEHTAVGVGDDVNSYAYDGSRCRAWHGDTHAQEQVEYGDEWRPGDVVTVLFDVDEGTMGWINRGWPVVTGTDVK